MTFLIETVGISGKREGRVKYHMHTLDSAWVWRMGGLTQHRTREPNSRDLNKENCVVLVQLITSRIGAHIVY